MVERRGGCGQICGNASICDATLFLVRIPLDSYIYAVFKMGCAMATSLTAAQWFLLFSKASAHFVGFLRPACFCYRCHGSCCCSGSGDTAPHVAYSVEVIETSCEIDASPGFFALQRSSRRAPRDSDAFGQRTPFRVQESHQQERDGAHATPSSPRHPEGTGPGASTAPCVCRLL